MEETIKRLYVMKKYLLFYIIIISCLYSCETDNTKSRTLPLYVNIEYIIKTNGEKSEKDSLYIYNSKYLELSIAWLERKDNYFAGDFIGNTESILKDNAIIGTLLIVDKDSKEIMFTSNTEFLNFMYERGYEVVDKIKFDTYNEYLFKRTE